MIEESGRIRVGLIVVMVLVMMVIGFGGIAGSVSAGDDDEDDDEDEQSAYIILNINELTCQNGGTQIYHYIKFAMFLPEGYYVYYSNSQGAAYSRGPNDYDLYNVDWVWDESVSAAPYNETSFIFDDDGTVVFETGYSADCTGVKDGDRAHIGYFGNEVSEDEVSLLGTATTTGGTAVGVVIANTPLYYAPQSDAATNVVIEAGKTFWVYGVDATASYYKVMLSEGQYFWLPVGTMAPNTNDALWEGAPLPTNVVE